MTRRTRGGDGKPATRAAGTGTSAARAGAGTSAARAGTSAARAGTGTPAARGRPLADDGPAPGRPIEVRRLDAEHQPPLPTPSAVSHSYTVLIFYTGGRAEVEQRSRWSLGPGDALLVPAGEPHRVLGGSAVEAWGLRFCAPCLLAEERLGGDARLLLAPFERARAGAAAVVQVAAERRAYLGGLFAELAAAAPGGDLHAAVQHSLLTLILAEVARAAASVSGAASDDLVARSLCVIERRCLGPLSLAQVAAAVRRSPAHVTTAVKRATGRSVGEWIVAGRLAEARRRLLHSDEMVDVIAERVGYRDVTHFIRQFRRAHGLTPAAWRTRERRRT